MVQIQMFILHKNFTKWAAGCTKTFGEGVGVGRGVAVQEGNTDSGQSLGMSEAEGRWGHRPGPVPRCMRTHAHSLPVDKEEGFWAGSTVQT